MKMKKKTKKKVKTTTRTIKTRLKGPVGNKKDEKFNELIRIPFTILDVAIFLMKQYAKDRGMQHLVDLRYTLKKLISEIETLIKGR